MKRLVSLIMAVVILTLSIDVIALADVQGEMDVFGIEDIEGDFDDEEEIKVDDEDNGYISQFTPENFSVYLPDSLKTIEEEAFYGNTSMKSVVLPYGLESVNSRAFANGALDEIYIPSTVKYIAKDAFEGRDDLIIRANSESYAAEYAESHDLLCISTGTQYEKEKIDLLLEEMEKGELLEEDYIGDLVLSELSIDEFGEDYDVEIIQKYNDLVNEMIRLEGEYTETLENLNNSLNELAKCSNEVERNITSDGTEISIDGSLFGIYGDGYDILDKDYKVESVLSNSDENSVILEINGSGGKKYIFIDEDGMTLKDSLGSARTNVIEIPAAMAAAVSESITESICELLANKVSSVETWIDVAGENILKWWTDCGESQLASKKTLDYAQSQYDKAREMFKKSVEWDDYFGAEKYSKESGIWLKKLEEEKTNYENIGRRVYQATWLKGFWHGLSFKTNFDTIRADIRKLGIVKDIINHGHPTNAELGNAELLMVIDELNKHIATASIALGIDTINAGIGLYESISGAISTVKALAGAVGVGIIIVEKVAVEATKAALKNYKAKLIAQGMVSVTGEYAYNVVTEADFKLHSYVWGTITDEDTGKPIPRVKVTCQNVTAYSNAKGEYAIRTGTSAQIIEFTKQGYNMRRYQVNTSTVKSRKMNITMQPRGTVAGRVKDATTGLALSDVTVTYGYYQTITDSEGFYQFVLPIDTANITFHKDGYIDISYENVEVKKGVTISKNAVMSKELESNQFRVVLTWGSDPSDLDSHLVGPDYHVYYSSRTGTNAELDLDDTNSYGPETITFTADSDKTYTYFVHDYSNGSNPTSTALSRSSATVNVFSGNELIATLHVPGGVGVYWNVFTIVNGEYALINRITQSR